MDKWVAIYQQTHPKVQINYRPIGSGGGIEEMKKGFLSFGATDTPLTDEQAKEMTPVVQIPASGSRLHCLQPPEPQCSAETQRQEFERHLSREHH